MSTTSSVGAQSASQLIRTPFRPPSFASLDSNSDSSLTLDELMQSTPKGASDPQSASRAQALFSAMDKDGDSSVTSAEKDAFDKQMADRMQGMAFMTQQMAAPSNADIFKETDSNGDGSVSLAELGDDAGADAIGSEGLKKLFDLLDSNGDGAITETESSSFLDAVRSALQDASGNTEHAHAGGPPPGGPPPGGPPPSASNDGDADDQSTATSSLLATAKSAYGNSAHKTLLEQLASIFETAA
jgi:Ca2+-binding EF-hand superfamily protein